MHGSFDRFQENRHRTDRDWNVALFALPVLVVIALVTLLALCAGHASSGCGARGHR